MSSSMNHRQRANLNIALVIAAILALSSNNNHVVVESLAFLDSKSSSSFTSCSNSASLQTTKSLPSNSHHSRTSTSTSLLTMKVSSSSSKRTRSSKSSHLIELNNQRLQTAGRPGTKKFMDPNKVFIGNLPYDATENDVLDLFSKHWSIPIDAVNDRIESVKIIQDWKTNQSKGYGFIQFYEPMVATSAMESVNKGQGKGWRIKGRKIRLDQGKRKESEEDERMKKKKKQKQKKTLEMSDLDEEGLMIHSVLEDVEGASMASGITIEGTKGTVQEEEENDEDGLGMSEDDMITFMEKGGLRGVMPLTEETAGFLGIEGLYDDDDDDGYDDASDYFQEYYSENGYSDADFETDNEDGEDDEDDGGEIVYDGVFEEMYNPNEYEGLSEEEEESIKKMNREQRRAAEKRRKKRKLPFRGFGSRD